MTYQEIINNPSIQYAIVSGRVDGTSEEDIMRFYRRIHKIEPIDEKKRELAEAQIRLSEMLPGTARIEQASKVWKLKRELKTMQQEKYAARII